jgi:hypothetical protein
MTELKMSYFYIAIKNAKSGKFELLMKNTGDKPESFGDESTAIRECKYRVQQHGEENVMLVHNIPLDVTVSVKLREK